MQKYQKLAIEFIGALDYADEKAVEEGDTVMVPARQWRIMKKYAERAKSSLNAYDFGRLKNVIESYRKIDEEEEARS